MRLGSKTLKAKQSESEWKEILAGTDYTILVLKAIALLSEQEREFIREILLPNFGLERVAILLNQMDLVPEEEKSSISELLKSFLGSFESQPIAMEFSAAKGLEGLVAGDIPRDCGYEALMNLVQDDLLSKHAGLKSAAIRQGVEICLGSVEDIITRQNALIVTQTAKLQEILLQIDSKNQGVKKGIERSKKKIEAVINTLVKEEFFREIEGFSFALREQISARNHGSGRLNHYQATFTRLSRSSMDRILQRTNSLN